mmetsp:Transcript_1632/g.5562  ORF Transcript_1632/g.5562 Transcript_1632/m.5562 type:complete len:207 (-) Transcript_1632:385-1005(-)
MGSRELHLRRRQALPILRLWHQGHLRGRPREQQLAVPDEPLLQRLQRLAEHPLGLHVALWAHHPRARRRPGRRQLLEGSERLVGLGGRAEVDAVRHPSCQAEGAGPLRLDAQRRAAALQLVGQGVLDELGAYQQLRQGPVALGGVRRAAALGLALPLRRRAAGEADDEAIAGCTCVDDRVDVLVREPPCHEGRPEAATVLVVRDSD